MDREARDEPLVVGLVTSIARLARPSLPGDSATPAVVAEEDLTGAYDASYRFHDGSLEKTRTAYTRLFGAPAEPHGSATWRATVTGGTRYTLDVDGSVITARGDETLMLTSGQAEEPGVSTLSRTQAVLHRLDRAPAGGLARDAGEDRCRARTRLELSCQCSSSQSPARRSHGVLTAMSPLQRWSRCSCGWERSWMRLRAIGIGCALSHCAPHPHAACQAGGGHGRRRVREHPWRTRGHRCGCALRAPHRGERGMPTCAGVTAGASAEPPRTGCASGHHPSGGTRGTGTGGRCRTQGPCQEGRG